jgi:uncharacterized protein (TIGR01777 family)
MKIGITGAGGLIGSHVAALARERGHEVIGFTRSPDGRGPSWRLFTTDEPPDVKGCDAILNLAGERVVGFWTPAKRRAIRESRILATRRIVEAMQAAPVPPRVLVNGSAIGFYGDTGDRALDEGSPRGRGFLADVCEAWEAEALKAAENGVRVVLLRTGVVLASEGGALAAMLPAFRLGLGGRLGSGRQWLAWIHIADEAALALEAIENSTIQGPMNATAPNPVTNDDFTKALAATLHRPAFFAVPALALRTALDGFAGELLESRRILPAAAGAAGYQFRFPLLVDALGDLLKSRRNSSS